MTIADTVYSTLNNDAGVRAYVGITGTSPQHSRIYYDHAPESADRPYIVFFGVSKTNLDTLSGVGDMRRTTIQLNLIIDAETSTPEIAEAFGDAVETALEGNGYLQIMQNQYDAPTKSYMRIIDWAFLS
jgi:hypothetical protein